jgi:putative membrane protein
MNFVELLPTLIATLNLTSFVLLLWAWRAIREGDRERHKTLMVANLGVAAMFLALYITQLVIVGHKRFPGDDWVRTGFLILLGTHTVAAVSLLPLVPLTLYRAFTERFDAHRRVARITLPIWIYVSVTGVMVYWMVNHFRPGI